MRNNYYDDYDEYDYHDDYDYKIKFDKFLEDDEEEDNEKAINDIDEDLLQCLDDARMPTKATSFKPAKKKKPEQTFDAGEVVTYRGKEVTIIFGPYEKNYKMLYEIQTHDGKVISAVSTSLHKK